MEVYRKNNIEITVDKAGAERFGKVSYPIRYGRYSEIKTSEYLFQFNLNGEIKFIRGLSRNWPHPAEWLKRTDANDWVFYSVGGYNGIYYLLGEYYLPCLPYQSNSIWSYNPFADADIQRAFVALRQLLMNLGTLAANVAPPTIKKFLFLASHQDEHTLAGRSKTLHTIIGNPISVLPPDTRHVDYDVVPLMIADGCLYHCDFCSIKTSQKFRPRSKANIRRQVQDLKHFYGTNLKNYNALFLGNHDALAAGSDLILTAAELAFQSFNFKKSYLKNPTLYIFGSVDSLLRGGKDLIEAINGLPYYTYINIGFESADAETLQDLSKPLKVGKIKSAFQMMLNVNRSYPNVEITANFLLDDRFPPNHYRALSDLTRTALDQFYSKGALYLSPVNSGWNKNELIRKFVELKNLSKLPTYLYLIQRL